MLHKRDAIIIGGGIAGLFTLAKLINQGYSAVLLEKNALGNRQTCNSQGIIHGGTKYALNGKMTEAQQQIARMPSYWRACLSGKADVDLSTCRVLADKQLMWAMPTLSSRITGFFASQFMQSHVEPLLDSARPIALQSPLFRGKFYALDEPVIDTTSLIESFAKQYAEHIMTDCQIDYNDNDEGNDTDNSVTVRQNGQVGLAGQIGRMCTFQAKKIFITAGEGNGEFAEQQLRPLRMIRAFVPKSFGSLFIHVLEASDKPRLTVTSYSEGDQLIWYLGGNVAEKGAKLGEAATIVLAQKELTEIFPWLDFSTVIFETELINRAEGLADGKRPDKPTIVKRGNQIIAWPTKLALAPMLADQLLACMHALD